MRVFTGSGKIERIFQLLRSVGFDGNALPARPEATLHRHRPGWNLHQQFHHAAVGRRVADDDLAAIHHVDEEFLGNKMLARFAIFVAMAVVIAEQVLANQQRRQVGGRIRALNLLLHQQQRRGRLQRALLASSLQLMFAGGERQVRHGERHQHFQRGLVGLHQGWRNKRLSTGSQRIVEPELIGWHDVWRGLLRRAVPIVVFEKQLGRLHRPVELARLSAARRFFVAAGPVDVFLGFLEPFTAVRCRCIRATGLAVLEFGFGHAGRRLPTAALPRRCGPGRNGIRRAAFG